MSVQDRFLKYVKIDTQSDPHSDAVPSTAKQLDLAKVLKEELEELGLKQIRISDSGIVYAMLPATADKPKEAIGLIAHMDTAQEMPGKDVKPRVIEKWDGSEIHLNEEWSMKPEDFPELRGAVGDTIIVTDGTTLLGADDKAGVAIIMQAVEELLDKPRVRDIWVAFTPDEEIGKGVDHFDLEGFPVAYAYTVDGGNVAEVDYETFNAAAAVVTIQGQSIHPGSAKDKMVNAALIGAQFAMELPGYMTPAHTSGREGFIHLISIEGICEKAVLEYILRDHDKQKLQDKKDLMQKTADYINAQYGPVCKVEIRDQYQNMVEYMNGDFTAVNRAMEAIRQEGLNPVSHPVRGGTDGAMLTVKGLITPNLGTGGGNCHGRFEFASVDKMEAMIRIIHSILKDEIA